MAGKPPYPRKAWIVEISDGSRPGKIGHYQLHANHPYPDTLISEHSSHQEATDALKRYTGEDKS